MKHTLYCLALLLLSLPACTSVKQMTLVQDMTEADFQLDYPEFIIGTGDELSISIRALNEDAAAPFNTGSSYFVDTKGKVKIPVLGDVDVVGKTLSQAQETIESLLVDKLQNAFVNITLPTASIIVLGEVNAPQRMRITKSITIFEAIGAAGGLTPNARVNQVEVVRLETGKAKKYTMDLSSKEVLQSPCFYLIKGDVVSILPLHAKKSFK